MSAFESVDKSTNALCTPGFPPKFWGYAILPFLDISVKSHQTQKDILSGIRELIFETNFN